MTTAGKIEDALFAYAPKELAEDWDNVGLLVGSREAEITRAVVALDCTEAVIAEAVARQAQLIVTHHPVIFGGIKTVRPDDGDGRVYYLMKNDIAVISMHTNLDAAEGGVNDILAALCSLENAEPLGSFCRIGTLAEPCSIGSFASQMRSILRAGSAVVGDAGLPVQRVVTCSGAGGDFIEDARAAGADTFLTGELKYHQISMAREMGMNLVALGHYETEAPVCRLIADYLNSECEAEFLVSKAPAPVKYF